MAKAIQLWQLMRPRQWVKSGFVLMGILFAHQWNQPEKVRQVLMVLVAFSLVASGVYVLNDLLDRKNDLQHPQKKNRPLAAGKVSTRAAVLLLAFLWLSGFLLGFLASPKVLTILVIYALINFGYSLGLKHIVILDVFIIASGFILRILAGTSGIAIAPSQWLLICGLMVALFLGFAKRRAELYALSAENSEHRKVLKNYQPVLLDKMIVITASCIILTYSLYTMSPVTIQTHKTDALIYTVPFVMYAIFRYIYSLHNQKTGTDPAQELLRDPHILLSIGGWLVLTLWLISGRA
jgi:4-hydroxybenzoate polyprenyltransferase